MLPCILDHVNNAAVIGMADDPFQDALRVIPDSAHFQDGIGIFEVRQTQASLGRDEKDQSGEKREEYFFYERKQCESHT